MPAVIQAQAMLVPNRMTLTRDEALRLADNIDLLRGKHVDEIVISTGGSKTVKIRRDGTTSIQKPVAQTVADTTWSETNVVVSLAGHNLIRLQHALRDFGTTKAEYLLDVPNSPVNSIRFTLTGNVSV